MAQIGVRYWAYVHAVLKCLVSTEVDKFFHYQSYWFSKQTLPGGVNNRNKKTDVIFSEQSPANYPEIRTLLSHRKMLRGNYLGFLFSRKSRIIQTVTSFVIVYRNMIIQGLKSIICKI